MSDIRAIPTFWTHRILPRIIRGTEYPGDTEDCTFVGLSSRHPTPDIYNPWIYDRPLDGIIQRVQMVALFTDLQQGMLLLRLLNFGIITFITKKEYVVQIKQLD